MNNRSWTWQDEIDLSEEEIDLRTPAINDLVSRWNAMENEREERYFLRQSSFEAGEYNEPDFDTEEEMRAHELRQRINRELQQSQVELLETKIHELGARLMRPYEHWNEDEQLMAYLERDY